MGGWQNSESQAYDAFGQLAYQVQDGTRHDYTYDLSGNLLADLTWSGGQRYGRTAVVAPGHNRLAEDSLISGANAYLNARYFYSVNGERVRDEPHLSVQQWRRTFFDALGKLTSVEGYQVYQYNRAPDTEVNYYSSSGVVQANINSCRYDALGRQIKPCGGLAMSFDGSQVVRVRGSRLIYGPSLGDLIAVYDSALGAGSYAQYYALTDGAGHLYSFTSASGADQREAVNQIYLDRASFSGAIVRGHRFTAAASESYASEDLSFFRNRYYDQRTGQWLTEDPIGVAGGLNLYGYVGNNPVAYTDPFGLCPEPGNRGAALCNWIRAAFTAAGTGLGAGIGGGAGLATGPGAVVATPYGTLQGAAAGAAVGLAVGTAVTNVLFDNASQMANAGRGGGDNRVPNAEVRRIVREHDLNRAGQRALHDEITGQNLTLDEIRDMAARLAEQAKYLRNPPPTP